MSWLTDILINTPPKYRFRLEGSIKKINLRHPPLEWEEGILEINRRLEVGGVFSSFSVKSLTFIKEGADLLTKLYEQDGMNAQCTLRVYYFNTATRNYVEFPSAFNLNFKFFKPRVKIGAMSTGVQIEALNSAELDKLDNRKGVDLDITKTTSIGRYSIVDWTSLLKDLQIHAIKAFRKANWSWSSSQNYDETSAGVYYVYIPITLGDSDFIESKSVAFYSGASRDKTKAFYYDGQEDRTLTVTGQINITINTIDGGTSQIGFNIDVINSSSGLVTNHNLANYTDIDSGNKTITISETITPDSTESLILFALVNVETSGEVDFDITSVTLNISEEISFSEESLVEALPIYESGERLAQMILDSQYAFYSEFFGRTDTPYNSSSDVYASENQLRFASILSGLHLRGKDLSDDDAPIPLSFDKWFQTVKSIWNVGYSLEVVSGSTRIRVEAYEDFFDGTQVLDLSSRINELDIESEVMPDLAPLDVKTGYKNFEYESINGRGEYNTLHQRTTILNTDVELNNVCDLRGDTKGIADQLASPISSTNSTDVKGDNHVFIIKTQRNTSDPGIDWDAETDENVSINDDTSLFGDTSLNLYITPTRNLVRLGNRIKSALTKFLSSYIQFQVADKAQTLNTTGEGYTITENDDILVDDLDDPIYLPLKHTVEVKFTWTDLVTLLTNQNGLVKFTDQISGYVLNLKKKNNEDKALITIIEKYDS